MNFLAALFHSSIGKKFLMAVSGLVLIGFIIGHLLGNLQIFLHPERINTYAHFLESLGPGLWLARAVLLAALVVHVWMAVVLTVENRRARPIGYERQFTLRTALTSRTMRLTGFVVLAFVFFHLAHFTFRVTHPEYNELTYTLATGPAQGLEVRDVHSMMIYGFRNVPISLFYIVAVGLLSMHLAHGFDSMFQTVGLRNGSWSRSLHGFSVGFSILYFLGNAAIPLGILAGLVTLHNGF